MSVKWVTNLHEDDIEIFVENVSPRVFFTGEPKPTEACSLYELVRMGIVGIYYPEKEKNHD